MLNLKLLLPRTQLQLNQKKTTKAFKPQVSTKHWWFCPHISKTGNKFVKVWSGNKNGGRFFDRHIEINLGVLPTHFFGGKILEAKVSPVDLQQRTNKNKNCCRNWLPTQDVAAEKLGHCSLLLMRMEHPLENLQKSAIPSDCALALSSEMQCNCLLGVLCCEFNKLLYKCHLALAKRLYRPSGA